MYFIARLSLLNSHIRALYQPEGHLCSGPGSNMVKPKEGGRDLNPQLSHLSLHQIVVPGLLEVDGQENPDDGTVVALLACSSDILSSQQKHLHLAATLNQVIVPQN